MITKEIEAIFQKYDIPVCLDVLECDGATNVISQILLFEGVPYHRINTGLLMTNPPNLDCIGHVWIEVSPVCWIDFKARMWSAHPDAPNGIFNPEDHSQFYKVLDKYRPRNQHYLARILADIDLNLFEPGVST